MFNVYRFISSTVNAAVLTSALQSLLALATAEAVGREGDRGGDVNFSIHQSAPRCGKRKM